MSSHYRRVSSAVTLTTAAVLVLPMAVAGAAPATTGTGPSTFTAPYLLPVADDTHLTSLLTVDDAGSASNGYEMVGIPDGLGAIRQGANIVAYMNHELPATTGITRAHGQRGAFVSRMVIDPTTGRIKGGSDWMQPGVQYWDYLDKLVRGGSERCGHPRRRRRRLPGIRRRVRPVLLRLPHRSGRALQRGRQAGLQGPAVLRERGDRRRRSCLRCDQGG